MPFVRAGELDVFYQRSGRGKATVVLVHGLVMDNLASWWYTLAGPLAKGAEVICYDLRGHGLTSRPPRGYALADSVGDLVALLDALEVARPVHLVGNSYGGVVALATALAAPGRVASLVLVEAHAAVEGQWRKEREQLAHGLDLAGIFLEDAEVNDWLDRVGGRKVNRMARRAKDLIYETTMVEDLRDSPPFSEAQLARIACPVLLVYGERSDIFSRAVLLERLVPKARLSVVAGVDHSVLREAPGTVRALLGAWMEEHGAAGKVPVGGPG